MKSKSVRFIFTPLAPRRSTRSVDTLVRNVRDYQRKRVYRAGWDTWSTGWHPNYTVEKHWPLMTLVHMRNWTARLWADADLRANPALRFRDTPPRLRVTSGHGARWSSGAREIKFGPAYTTLPILLHELAHELNPTDDRHGPAFVRAHLALVLAVLGPAEEARYRANLRKHRVKF